MKKTLALAALAATLVSAQTQAADNNTLTTSQDFKTLTTAPAMTAEATPPVMAAPTQAPTQTAVPAPQKRTILKGGAHIVPDTTTNASGETFKNTRQGYAKMSTYNVVNDQNKPVTQDWTRPQSWRIGYKNKNRTPINE